MLSILVLCFVVFFRYVGAISSLIVEFLIYSMMTGWVGVANPLIIHTMLWSISFLIRILNRSYLESYNLVLFLAGQ